MPDDKDQYHHCTVQSQEDKKHVILITVWDHDEERERKIFLYKRHKEQWLKYTGMYFHIEGWFWIREDYIKGFCFSRTGNMRRFS